MRKLLSELCDDTIAAQRLRILQGINNTLSKFFIEHR